MKGSLHLVGTGFSIAGQMTPEALACVKNADHVLHILSDPATSAWLRKVRPDARTLTGLYGEGKSRHDTYSEMTRQMLSLVRKGHNVCVAFYGHPGVFVHPSHAAVEQAGKEGLRARMYPGLSAESCLFADLGIDPVARGCRSYEASGFLMYQRGIDTASSLILWQIGSVGVKTYHNKVLWSRDGLAVLAGRLLEHYPADHEAFVYEASQFPVCDPSIDGVRLGNLKDARVSVVSTLYVPPLEPAPVDEAMYGRVLGILGERGCRRVPFDAALRPFPPEAARPRGDGRLSVVGLGYGLAGHMTPETRFQLDKAERIFYLVSDPVSSAWLKATWPAAESLHPLYGESRDSEVFQAQMVEKMLRPLRRGERVCAAFTGHPAIVVPPALNAVSLARQEGFRARVLPAISIEDCLVAELGVDPGLKGRQLYDATDFLLRPRVVDTSANLVLLQAGTLGEQFFRSGQEANAGVVALLANALLKHYPPEHEAIIYETSQTPLVDIEPVSVPIGQLADAPLTVISTIFIPPARDASRDETMLRKLGLQ